MDIKFRDSNMKFSNKGNHNSVHPVTLSRETWRRRILDFLSLLTLFLLVLHVGGASSQTSSTDRPPLDSFTVTSTASSTTVTSNTSSIINRRLATFNASLSSYIQLVNSLDLTRSFWFSFRTCSSGVLVRQPGLPSADSSFRISVTDIGALEISWQFNASRESVSFYSDSDVRNSQWYTVEGNFLLGVLSVQLRQGRSVLNEILLSNSTYRRYLWSQGVEGLIVGEGFTGCIQEGEQVILSQSGVTGTSVEWGVCSVDVTSECKGSTSSINPCYSNPCSDYGTCIYSGSGTTYSCSCPKAFTGQNCETSLGGSPCEMEPCLNGGTCFNSNTTMLPYICVCVSGYSGKDCEKDLDECASSPCLSGAQCVDGINRYTCYCNATGYTGVNCETNIDECSINGTSLCVNGSTCMDIPGSYKCACPIGYAGADCKPIDSCLSDPCLNSGVCISEPGRFTCACSVGFTGSLCETDVNDCAGVSCNVINSVCVDGVNSFACRCLPGYHDPAGDSSFSNATACVDINDCESNQCDSGSTCMDEVSGYRCVCATGWTGTKCDVNVDECSSDPCQNNGSCTDGVGHFSCACHVGFTGSDCSIDIDECSSSPCFNLATCFDMIGEYKCVCAGGWTGELCEVEVDECQSKPCHNGASCRNLINSFNCSCLSGFTGRLCETNVDDCLEHPCRNNGTCADLINDYSCNCTPEWTGKNCTEVFDACKPSPCMNNGSCTTSAPSQLYQCSCWPGFTGANCETNIDDCVGHNCLSYEVCVDGIQNYTCQCPIGFTGAKCETEIDECASNPCMNGATCADQIGGFICTCMSASINLTQYKPTSDTNNVFRIGYNGTRCEQLINACDYTEPSICLNGGICRTSNATWDGFMCLCPNGPIYYSGKYCEFVKTYCDTVQVGDTPICRNGGTCVDTSSHDDYRCVCMPGYTGRHCLEEINECDSSPCQYNGTCQDRVNGYECSCIGGITGSNCEVNIDECISRPCQNGGECNDLINGYTCDCTDTGYTGSNCEIDIDECASSPCKHGALCNNSINSYSCNCYLGYTGINCETDIDECVSNPCANNATCRQRSESIPTNSPQSVTTPSTSINYTSDYLSTPRGSSSDDIQPWSNGLNYSAAAGYDCMCSPGYTGSSCEIDINECDSQPCFNGRCVDGINMFTCECFPGYKGVLCGEEIDECALYQPCARSSPCQDRIADYLCDCSRPSLVGNDYIWWGGKNCTTQLIGCRSNNCLNSATCMPVLVNESLGLHDYQCQCAAGFTGRFCELSTVLSFSSQGAWIRYKTLVNMDVVRKLVRLSFRTTLSDSYLLEAVDGNVLLSLIEGKTIKLKFKMSQVSEVTLTVMTQVGSSLNDAAWHEIGIDLTNDTLQLTLTHDRCNLGRCVSTFPLDSIIINGSAILNISQFTWGTVSIGSIISTDGIRGFIGCIRDFTLDSILLNVDQLLTNRNETGGQIMNQCSRNSDPCLSRNVCSQKGVCVDLWDSYECQCSRPNYGTNCENVIAAGTFAYDNSLSYVQFSIPPSPDYNYQPQVLDISFLFRTRRDSGLLLYAENNSTDIQFKSYCSLELLPIGVMARLQFANTSANTGEQTYALRGYFADGIQHLLQLSVSRSLVVLSVDTVSAQSNIATDGAIMVERIFVGGAPTKMGLSDMTTVLFTKETDAEGVSSTSRLPLISSLDPKAAEGPTSAPVLTSSASTTIYNYTLVNGTTALPLATVSYDVSDMLQRNLTQSSSQSTSATSTTTPTAVLLNGSSIAGSITEHTMGVLNRKRREVVEPGDSGLQLPFQSSQFDGTLQDIRLNNISLRLFKSNSTEGSDNSTGWDRDSMTIDPVRVQNVINGEQSKDVCLDQPCDVERVESCENVFFNDYKCTCKTGFTGKNCSQLDYCNSNLCPVNSVCKTLSDGFECVANSTFDGISSFVEYKLSAYNESTDTQVIDNPALVKLSFRTRKSTGIILYSVISTTQEARFLTVALNNGRIVILTNDEPVSELTVDPGITTTAPSTSPDSDAMSEYNSSSTATSVLPTTSNPATTSGLIIVPASPVALNYSDGKWHRLDIVRDDESVKIYVDDSLLMNVSTTPDVIYNLLKNGQIFVAGVSRVYAINYAQHFPEEKAEFFEGCLDEIRLSGLLLPFVTLMSADNSFGGSLAYQISTISNVTTGCRSVNVCPEGQCQNSATCADLWNEFECQCVKGFDGRYCEQNIIDCKSDSCADGATCVDGVASYTCQCPAGFSGARCEADIDECSSNPCSNGAECLDHVDRFLCLCSANYTGSRCDVDLTATCPSKPCKNGGTCVDINNGNVLFRCDCITGFSGAVCNQRADPCESNACQNGATCISHSTVYSYTCSCPIGFTGDKCSTNIDECQSNPCMNGGKCKDAAGYYICTCNSGFTGSVCETDINECLADSKWCHNGTCTNEPIGSFTCHCSEGFVGQRCNVSNPCMEAPAAYCNYRGNCTVESGNTGIPNSDGIIVLCACNISYTGNMCQKEATGSSGLTPNQIGLIVGLVVGFVLLCLVIVLIVLLLVARKKRATHGTYSPSRQEVSGSRLDNASILKLPPEERLI